MGDAERIAKLEHRVRELQTALATLITELRLQGEVTAAERRRIDEFAFNPNRPADSLLELYSTYHAP